MAGRPAAWFPDPTGRNEQRYWDGANWTDHVVRGGVQSNDAITGDYAPPMVLGPAPQRPRKKKPVWPWVVGGVGVAFVVLIGGCAVLVGVAVNEAVDELNSQQRAHAISQARFDAVPLGSTRNDVIRMVGKVPEDSQEFVREGVLEPGQINTSCIYYNRRGGNFGDRFQFCFEGDSLRSKNAF
jgi:hypothetical protein